MDCPNCGAYNASNSVRCRRCDHILPTGDDDSSSGGDWGPASGPEERWEDQFRQPPAQPEEEPEQQPESENPWAWSEPEAPQQTEWTSRQGPSYSDPPPEQSGSVEYRGSEFQAHVPNYLWPSIGATICCCAPLGIPAIVFASRVDAFLANGDRAAAEEASNKAKMWSLAAVGVAALFWIAIFCTGQFGGGAPT